MRYQCSEQMDCGAWLGIRSEPPPSRRGNLFALFLSMSPTHVDVTHKGAVWLAVWAAYAGADLISGRRATLRPASGREAGFGLPEPRRVAVPGERGMCPSL